MTESITASQLKADMAAVLRDAEALFQASASGGDGNAEARARIRDSLESARQRLQEAERAALDQGQEALHAAEDYARRNPWAAMGIAAGVGLLVGVLLSRR